MIPHPANADRIFVETFLRHEAKDEAAAIIAYKQAGYVEPEWPITVAAERVLARLQDQIDIARTVVKQKIPVERNRETILTDLDEIADSAMKDKDHSAAVNARRLQAQMLGYMQENINVTHRMDVSGLSDEQLERIASKAMKIIDGVAVEVKPKGIGHLKELDTG